MFSGFLNFCRIVHKFRANPHKRWKKFQFAENFPDLRRESLCSFPQKDMRPKNMKPANLCNYKACGLFAVMVCGKYAGFDTWLRGAFPQSGLNNAGLQVSRGKYARFDRIRQRLAAHRLALRQLSVFFFLQYPNHVDACHASKDQSCGKELQRQDFFVQNDGTGNQGNNC